MNSGILLPRASGLAMAAALAAFIAAPAMAQPTQGAEDSGLGEIIVTAQKRAENSQNVPIAITALSADKVISAGVTGTEDLRAAVPALNVTTAVGGFGLPRIRGIGATGQGPGVENPVAVYVDGVYYGASIGVLQSLFDVDQVAVLKGPQGTLFGRNATGGLMQISTKGPTFDWRGKAELGYGNYQTMTGGAFLSGPLSEKVAFSLSGQYENRDKGFGRNITTGRDVQTSTDWAMRGKLLFEPGETTKILLSGDFNGRNGADPAFINFGRNTLGQDVAATIRAAGGNPERDIISDFDPKLRARQWGTSLTIDQELVSMSLKSITAYRRSELATAFDPDGTNVRQLVITFNQLDKQFTQEVNLVSDDAGPFKWLLGGFYMHTNAGQLPYSRTEGFAIASVVGPSGYIDNITRVDLDSWSAFAEGTYKLGASTNLTAGVRFTSDKRSFAGNGVNYSSITGTSTIVPYTPSRLSNRNATWKVSLDHRFSPELLAYASYNRGFRAGGFGPSLVNGTLPTLRPELVDAFEVGIKSDLLDRKVRVNLSGYYNDQSTVQVMQIVSGNQLIYNAKGAKIYGIDGDISVKVSDNLQFFGGFNWIHARYKSFTDAVISIPYPVPSTFSPANYTYVDSVTGQTVANTACLGTFGSPLAQTGGNCLLRGDASGKKLQNTPEFTLSLGGNLDIPTAVGKFSLAGNVYYNGGYVGTPDERVVQPSFTTVSASLTWHHPDEHLYVRAWGRNLTNAFYRSQIGASNSGDNGYSGAPRTYGLAIGAEF
ncbi:TonB-dependent receptor [Novosphingobium flavum]|uniref:TonB-dependent receptor n=1 Tax=Novosphingobium flavum TaxID=1778672 RepID=A0A7X1FS69_9SPHN|nr:TonB-dependent receptor [Novosphingobium flavum]MBC2666006.1 TonB-dependent receptor [Novosphingobium flavum]